MSSPDTEVETFHVERKRGCAAWVCNLLWIVSGSFLPALFWFLLALVLCITIVGIPFGVQCYKMGKLALLPFGYKVSLSFCRVSRMTTASLLLPSWVHDGVLLFSGYR